MNARHHAIGWSLAVVLSGCGGKDTGPPTRVADRISLQSGGGQQAQAGSQLPNEISFVVADKNGPVAGVPVTFALSDHAGFTSAPSDTSGTDGVVSVHWTVGGSLGTQRLTAAIPSSTSAVAEATVTAGPLALITPLTNPNQFVVVGHSVASPPAVKASDGFGNPVADQEITFADASNQSTLVGATSRSDASGRAAVTSWTIGTAAGAYRVVATAPNGATTSFVAFGIPAAVQATAGDNQSANVGTLAPQPAAVLALDDAGHPVSGVSVSFAVTSGGGHLIGPVTAKTGADGIARSPGWVLGVTPGSNELTARMDGVPSLVFHATGIQAAAGAIEALTGTAETGFENNFGPTRPTVRVTDAAGQPVAGATVTFAATQGGGTLTGSTVTTDFAGSATLGAWRFGIGPQTVTATVGALAPIAFNAATQPAPPSGYHITVRFIGPTPTASQQAAFENAAARWGQVIVGHLSDVPFTVNDDMSFCGGQPLTETVHDLLIFAKIDAIDGPGNVLGQAGACYLRDENLLSVVGIMQFDSADVTSLESQGRFGDVVLHEMGHVIGLGSLWNLKDLITGRGTGDPFFVGESARMAFAAAAASPTAFQGNIVPVESTGGAGTRDVHWRESVLVNELMTGFLNSGPNPLSAITAASFRDQGYVVNDAAADPYQFGAALQAVTAAPIALRLVPATTAVVTKDRTGVVRRVLDTRDGPFKR